MTTLQNNVLLSRSSQKFIINNLESVDEYLADELVYKRDILGSD